MLKQFGIEIDVERVSFFFKVIPLRPLQPWWPITWQAYTTYKLSDVERLVEEAVKKINDKKSRSAGT